MPDLVELGGVEGEEKGSQSRSRRPKGKTPPEQEKTANKIQGVGREDADLDGSKDVVAALPQPVIKYGVGEKNVGLAQGSLRGVIKGRRADLANAVEGLVEIFQEGRHQTGVAPPAGH